METLQQEVFQIGLGRQLPNEGRPRNALVHLNPAITFDEKDNGRRKEDLMIGNPASSRVGLFAFGRAAALAKPAVDG